MAKKIKPSKRNISRNYSQQLLEAKEAYKKSNGLKIARGFSKSKDFKRINRNKTQAIRRFENKRVEKFTNNPTPQNPNVQNFLELDTKSSFYNVLSFGSKTDKIAMAQFKANARANKGNFKAVIDFKKLGLGKTVHYDQKSYEDKMKWIFKRLTKMQKDKKIGSMETVTTSIGTVDGVETLLVQLD